MKSTKKINKHHKLNKFSKKKLNKYTKKYIGGLRNPFRKDVEEKKVKKLPTDWGTLTSNEKKSRIKGFYTYRNGIEGIERHTFRKNSEFVSNNSEITDIINRRNKEYASLQKNSEVPVYEVLNYNPPNQPLYQHTNNEHIYNIINDTLQNPNHLFSPQNLPQNELLPVPIPRPRNINVYKQTIANQLGDTTPESINNIDNLDFIVKLNKYIYALKDLNEKHQDVLSNLEKTKQLLGLNNISIKNNNIKNNLLYYEIMLFIEILDRKIDSRRNYFNDSNNRNIHNNNLKKKINIFLEKLSNLTFKYFDPLTEPELFQLFINTFKQTSYA